MSVEHNGITLGRPLHINDHLIRHDGSTHSQDACSCDHEFKKLHHDGLDSLLCDKCQSVWVYSHTYERPH